MTQISQYAVVEKKAEIAPDVKIGAFSYIGPQVRISAGCIIENNVTVTGKTTLGEKTHVYPLAVIGSSPESGKTGECIIGEANAIREHVTIQAGTAKPTRVGTNNLIMIASHVCASAQISNHGIFANATHIGEGAMVEDYVQSSAFAIIDPGVTVGAYTFINGYTGVDRDVPPFAMIQGFPYRVRGVNGEKLRRCAFGDDDIHQLRLAFRELFEGNGSGVNTDALQRLLTDKSVNQHVRRVAEAVQRDLSRRGV